MLHQIEVRNEKGQSIAGLVVFAFFFWLTYSMFSKLGAELDRVCQIIERTGDNCETGAYLSMLFYVALAGCIFLGYIGFRFSNFMFQRKT
ncbi:hypothetical protein [Agrobacterium vitis]|uniref:hypothetical protein n=1 Tax=Agrobacterium vitis TaxID=373 RepID=UPI000872A204|nr:hypothetical protein [Agrobacterium vitis]MCE6073914.1 hypothetical protein [Agrobacterium vitis]MCM2450454.1 hypothetical protein [Agrobacterium vitis]MCM2468745.1 hypothetical protein [Agrobacterium vitis]MUO71540.1 hypothetical protein [Agrobacterium vitis]MUO86070.1 hypothetical protein [Agrobacterium vitis]